ncbi:FecR family protein [Ekhidna sp.]|uniref:FecR family protein n=1 Tax=Ekhidna sp. TaxID=2608089 RepID=UPI003297EE14
MSEFKDDTFLSRWINNQLSQDELAAFRKSENYNTFKKIVEASELIDSAKFDAQKILQEIKNSQQLKKAVTKQRSRKLWMYSAAASIILLLSFFIYSEYIISDITRYQTTIGQKMDVVLPDGSKVKLNANSSLSFSSNDWEENRELNLSGEGYFKVEKGNEFIIHTTSGDVSVLGTQFTVQELDDFFQVICFEGSVKVNSDEEEEILKPKTSVRKTRRTGLIRRVIKESKPTWLNNESSFESVAMSYVLLELKNQYGVRFEGAGFMENLSFNGSFPHDDLDLALKIVLDPIDINYEKKGNVIVLSKN